MEGSRTPGGPPDRSLPRPPAGGVVPAEMRGPRLPVIMTPALRKAIVNRMLFFRQASLDKLCALTGVSGTQLRRFRQELSESELPGVLLKRGANLAITRELPQGALLYLLVRALRPQRAVETGVRPGYSTAWILAALEANDAGELISLGPGGVAGRASGVPAGLVGQLVAPELRRRWTLVLGNSEERLEEILRGAAPIGLYLYDNGPDLARARFELRKAWTALDGSGMLLSHHTDANGAWAEFCRWQGVEPQLLDPGPPPMGALSVRTAQPRRPSS